MVDYRNHRHFTLRCIKVRITPVSCKIKNPIQFKTARSYYIIHKAERQLLYDRVRNINRVLDMYEHNQFLNCTCLKKQISEDDLFTCIQFINMIKEHIHEKIKSKKIDKFKGLVRKHSRYNHNCQQNSKCCPLQIPL